MPIEQLSVGDEQKEHQALSMILRGGVGMMIGGILGMKVAPDVASNVEIGAAIGIGIAILPEIYRVIQRSKAKLNGFIESTGWL